jgi:hypothetical protein
MPAPPSKGLELPEGVMAKLCSNLPTPWTCIRLPDDRARPLTSEARRMLAKLGELHQSLHPGLVRIQGAAWGSTCLDRP